MERATNRVWWQTALLVVALLIVPFGAWWLVPAAPAREPSRPTAAVVPVHDDHDDEHDDPQPSEAPPPPPRPAERAPPPPSDDSAQPLRGVVVDSEGRSVDGAWVGCAKDQKLFGTSDTRGRFELPPEAAGCEAYASHSDYGRSPSFTVSTGSELRVELPSPGSISGFVVDEASRPVASFLVAIEAFEPRDPQSERFVGSQRSVEHPQGAFELPKLAAGKYVLVVSADGRPPTRSDRIEVDPGRSTRGVRIVLPRGGQVVGTVIDRESGEPIAGVSVRLDAAVSTGASGPPPVITAADGSYTLEGVPEGPFSLRFTHRDYRERIVPLVGQRGSPLKTRTDLAPRGDGPSSELTGIGATLAQSAGYVSVAGVLPGGPAALGGMKPGDRIERIDGASAEGYTVSQCVQLLRGPEGTTVTVLLGRGDSTVELTLTRATVTR